jgi:RNA polymerase-binding transcription factor DksA
MDAPQGKNDAATARRTLMERWRSLTARREAAERESHELFVRPEPDWEDRAADVTAASSLESLADNERAQLVQVAAALERLDRGAWGTCVACGEPIAAARLQALPEAARCARCTNHH